MKQESWREIIGELMKRIFITTISSLLLTGCAGLAIDSAISKYKTAASQISLGDQKEKVLELLQPTQQTLLDDRRKSSEKYLDGETLVEIYYFRSRRVPDNLTTDDEFTPYVFRNGKLTAIGWASLGGPKSVAQPPSPSFTIGGEVKVPTR